MGQTCMKTTWIVAADASRARVLQVADRERLVEVEEPDQPRRAPAEPRDQHRREGAFLPVPTGPADTRATTRSAPSITTTSCSPSASAITSTRRAPTSASSSWSWSHRRNSSVRCERSSARKSASWSPTSCPRTSPGSTSASWSATSRKEVGERLDVGVAHAIQRRRHDGVAAAALAVAVGAHLRCQVVLALPGEPRHLVLAAEVRRGGRCRSAAPSLVPGPASSAPCPAARVPCPSPAASRSARRA